MKHLAIFGLGDDIDEHITQIKNNGSYKLTGIYDHNTIEAKKIADNYEIKCFAYPLDATKALSIMDIIEAKLTAFAV